jgi:hypothetical protein
VAVAYKSQGDGTGTETSGAALNLACPAAVDANDILIAHVIHLNITTAPTEPADWDLLYGPANLGTGTAVGRAWVYGKLAVGDEDGDTIGFGTDGGTSGRFGRIYSFSGYNSGTLADVVPASQMSDTPTESSIPLPTVTTTMAGGLAVALLTQDDNNAFAAATGESGGSWTEPVAEFVSTSIGAQGCICGIQVCTPTGDPGTVTGGTANSTTDEGSTIGLAIQPDPIPQLGPVREFNGTSDTLDRATGALSGMTHGTVASIFRTDDVTVDYQDQFSFHNSGGSFLWAALNIHAGTSAIAWFTNTDGIGPDISTGTWYLVVTRKATGTAPVRFSLYNYTSTTWTHANSVDTGGSAVSLANGTSPGASGTIRFEFQDTSSYFDGRVAVQAAWANAVHWSADSTGDAAIEAAGLESALQAWSDESPDALWAFNQASTGTAVDDLTGGGADQAAINGTTVVTIDGPDPFDWSLTAGVTGTGLGAYTFTGAAAGIPETFGTATGAYTFTSTAAGIPDVHGTSTAAYTFTGTAAGQAGAPTVTGTGQGAYTFTGAAAGVPETFGAAAANIAFGSTAAGIDRALGTGAGTYTFGSTAAGIDRTVGSAATSLTFGSTSSGIPDVHGTAAGGYTFTGTASGFVGAPPVTGQAAGIYTFMSTAAGIDRAVGAAASPLTFSSTAAGIPEVFGATVAPFTVSPTAIGQRKTFAQAAAILAFTATGSGFVGELPIPAGIPLYAGEETHTVTTSGTGYNVTVHSGSHVVEAR